MNDEFLVGLNEYKILNDVNPLGYTRDIQSCIGVLIHKKNYTALIHVESYDNSIELDNFYELLKAEKDNEIISVDIFMGNNTSYGNLSIIAFVLHKLNINYNVYDVFVNSSNETSLGYNFNTKEYYMVSMDKGKPIFTKKLVK